MADRAPSKVKIKESLMQQLKKRGAKIECFEDLICDYISFYDIKKQLQRDIRKRGVSYEQDGSAGGKIVKQNQSVKDLVAVNKQMLTILEKLNLTTDMVDAINDEEL